MVKIINLFVLALLVVSFGCQSPQPSIQTVEEDAAWCWFSDPRAIMLNQNDEAGLISGGVAKDGSVVAFSYNSASQEIERGIIHPQLEKDDHNNPAFLELPDGKILAFYTRHHNKELFVSGTSKSGDITGWEQPQQINISNPEEVEIYGTPYYTYANPFLLSSEENRIYLFGRWMGFKPTMIWSDDLGKTWSNSRVVVCPQPFDAGNRPYVKYFSDGSKRIHITFTDGHPRNEPTNSVYYAYYENGAFYRADGALICPVDSLPFEPREATMVYQGNKEQGRAWVYDMKADEKGNPVIVYARYPSEQDHIYRYARYGGNKWQNVDICNSGRWFPETPEGENEREPHYSGGLVIDGNNLSTVYLSRQVNGTFEIEKWRIDDNGSWSQKAITRNSELDQVRPFVPWWSSGETPDVLWMENKKYVHYTDYESRIKMLVRE